MINCDWWNIKLYIKNSKEDLYSSKLGGQYNKDELSLGQYHIVILRTNYKGIEACVFFFPYST